MHWYYVDTFEDAVFQFICVSVIFHWHVTELITTVYCVLQCYREIYSETVFSVKTWQTRFPSNLRQTTRKCVHFVTRGHFWSRDKDGGHTIQSIVAENPILHANFTSLCVIEAELLSTEVLHYGNRDFWHILLPWPWPWPNDFRIWTWHIFPGDAPDEQK